MPDICQPCLGCKKIAKSNLCGILFQNWGSESPPRLMAAKDNTKTLARYTVIKTSADH